MRNAEKKQKSEGRRKEFYIRKSALTLCAMLSALCFTIPHPDPRNTYPVTRNTYPAFGLDKVAPVLKFEKNRTLITPP